MATPAPAFAGPSELAIHPGMAALPAYPFPRLRALIAGIEPGKPEIDLSIGEPKHAVPPMVADTLAANADLWNRYPPPLGTPALRAACTSWLNRRFNLPGGLIDADRHVLPLSGTKEGLFACGLLLGGRPGTDRSLAAMPNPLYLVYPGAAHLGGLEPVYLSPPDIQTGILDPDALDPAMLDRLALLFLCNPANPQGGILDRQGLEKLIALARHHGFVLVSDECYAEIYYGDPPPSALEVCGGSLDNLLVFHSLSKRSNAAGVRAGFVAGDERLIKQMGTMRNFGAAGIPLPVQAAAAALWDDDAHVAENRALYREKFEAVDAILGGSVPCHQPEAGFFLWLDLAAAGVTDGEAFAKTLWREQGLRAVPGSYLTLETPGQPNPAADYIRLAVIHDTDTMRQAMVRLAEAVAAHRGAN